MIASVMRIQVGDQVVEGAVGGDFVGVVRELGAAVASRHRDFFAARVLLGHVLRQLREQLGSGSFEDLVVESGVHRRRVSEAMRLAAEIGGPHGEVDWDRYRKLVGEGSQPSVRAVIARAQERDRKLHQADEEPIELVEAADVDEEPIELVDADAAPLYLDRPAEARTEAGAEVEPRTRASAPVARAEVEPRTRASAKGAAGEQLGLGELFLQAERQLEDLERTLELLGVEDAGSLLVAVRDRIRH